MPALPLPSQGQGFFSIKGDQFGLPIALIFGVSAPTTSNLTQGEANSLAAHLFTTITGNLKALSHTSTNYTHLQLTYVGNFGELWEATHEQTVVGTHIGTPLDASTALLLSWHTSAYWRGGHPRSYVPGMVLENMANIKSWSSTFKDLGTQMGNECISEVATNPPSPFTSVTLGFLHRKRAGALLEPPQFFPYISCTAKASIASQRRRLGQFA